MRSLTAALIPIVVCALGPVAVADDDSPWDGSYVHASRGGNELCPDSSATVVISGGAFSIPWNVKLRGTLFHVGTIAGSVRPSGHVTVEATVRDPFPADALEELRALGDSVEQLQTIASEMRMRLYARKARTIDLTSGNCYAGWDAPAVAAPVKARAKPATAAKPAKRIKPPRPLAAGSAKWDATYKQTMDYRSDWRCPRAQGFEKVVLERGRFSIPWIVDAVDGRGQEYGEMALGQIDGTVAANGKVKLRTWFSVAELPPELADDRTAKEATLEYVGALAATMTFTSRGGARTAHLTFGPQCEYDFEDAVTVAKKKARSVGKSTRSGGGGGGGSSGTPARRRFGNGMECSSDSDCLSGNCDDEVCSSGDSSEPDLAKGAACASDSDCASDDCDDGECQ